MKLQNTTIALLVSALLLGIGVFWLESNRRDAVTSKTAQPQAQKIFNFEEAQIKAFQVQTQQQALSFIKLASNPNRPDQTRWQMLSPKVGPADEASIAYLLNLLATGQANSSLTVPIARLIEFGLDKPLATVDVTLENQTQHRLVIGNSDFSGQFIFAQVDPAKGQKEVQILIIPKAFVDAVDRPLSEWQKQ